MPLVDDPADYRLWLPLIGAALAVLLNQGFAFYVSIRKRQGVYGLFCEDLIQVRRAIISRLPVGGNLLPEEIGNFLLINFAFRPELSAASRYLDAADTLNSQQIRHLMNVLHVLRDLQSSEMRASNVPVEVLVADETDQMMFKAVVRSRELKTAVMLMDAVLKHAGYEALLKREESFRGTMFSEVVKIKKLMARPEFQEKSDAGGEQA